jgi:hypothetical protein
MTHLSERTDPRLKGLRVFVQFSKEELQKRWYLLPPATIIKSYAENVKESEIVFHVLQLDGETSLTLKDEPVIGKPRLRRRWIFARSKGGALENLLERPTHSERIEVMLYVKRDDCLPCSDILDIDRDTQEICAGVITLMPEEKRGRANKVPQTSIGGRTLTIGVDDSEWLDLAPKVQLNTVLEIQLWIGPNQLLNHWGSNSPNKERQHLGINLPGVNPDLKLLQLRQETNLYHFAGIARRVLSRKYFDAIWQKDKEVREVLLDCGLPIVFEEIVDPGEPSIQVQKDGDQFVGVCYLFGSIAFSGTRFRTSLVAKVIGVTEMDFVPRFVLLDVELMPPSTNPQIRVGYHSKEQESLKGIELSGYLPRA